MINKLYQHKKLIGSAGLVLFLVILIDQLYKTARTNAIIQACTFAFGNLDTTQQKSIRLIVQAFDRYGDKDHYKLAYILATARHESNFRPIFERRASPQQATVYQKQNKYWYTGYYGRGFVQLTHERNYYKMSKFLGVDLVSTPSLALQPNYAAKILVYGMMNGLFTRKPLHYYINQNKIDFINARKTVNGLDKAYKIALYANSIKL